jgi:hypothetical protein
MSLEYKVKRVFIKYTSTQVVFGSVQMNTVNLILVWLVWRPRDMNLKFWYIIYINTWLFLVV